MKRFLALFMAMLLMLATLSACSSGSDDKETTATPEDSTSAEQNESAEGETTEAETEESDEIVLAMDGNLFGALVRSDLLNLGSDEVKLITAFRKTLIELTTLTIAYKTDYVGKNETYDPASVELLVGETNREESQALCETLGKYSYAIRTTGNKILIAAGNASLLERAINHFLEGLQSGEYGAISAGNLVVKKNIDLLVDCSDEYTFEIKLNTSNTMQATTSLVTTILGPSGTWPQGGYTDGKYYYQAFIVKDTASNEANNKVTLVKWDMETGTAVQEVTNYVLNHCNDIAYNPKTNRFIVSHNNPNRTKISILDPVTLEILETKTIEYKIYSIDYNETRNEYVVGVSGGQTFRILDENFRSIRGAYQPTRRTTGYTTQGVTCDENFIYFVLHNQNVITVYDWYGHFVTLIKLSVGSIEPENIGIVNEVIYISCGSASGKAKVFRVDDLVALPPEEEPPETTAPPPSEDG